MKRAGGRTEAAIQYQEALAARAREFYESKRMNQEAFGHLLGGLSFSTVSQNLRRPERMSEGFILALDTHVPQFSGCLREWRQRMEGTPPAGVQAGDEEARAALDEVLQLVRSIEERLLRLRGNCT
jgi:hypothetical protein